MSEERTASTRIAVDRVLEMAEEAEASGDALLEGSTLDSARTALHKWVDDMTGVVITPALGRVTIIHEGRESTISSPDLPFVLSAAVDQKGLSAEPA